MAKWQPIETAPKDADILLYGPSSDGPRVTEGYWMKAQYDYEFDRTHPAFWFSMDGGFTKKYPPTHWMPLPEPPPQ